MFAKNDRLSQIEFKQFFGNKSAKRFFGKAHTLLVIPGPFKVSVVVSKKVAKKAVVRNRLRRQAYGTISQFNQTTPLKAQVYIVLYKNGAAQNSRKDLAKNLTDLLARS